MGVQQNFLYKIKETHGTESAGEVISDMGTELITQ